MVFLGLSALTGNAFADTSEVVFKKEAEGNFRSDEASCIAKHLGSGVYEIDGYMTCRNYQGEAIAGFIGKHPELEIIAITLLTRDSPLLLITKKKN